MKIFINGKFLCQKITGAQRYATEIVKALDNFVEENIFYIIAPSKEYVLNELPKTLTNIKVIYIKGKPNYFWEQWTLPRYCKKNKPDDLLNLCNVAPILYPGSCTIHDIVFIDAPKGLNWKLKIMYKLITQLNVKRYNNIFTVSKTISKRIQEYYLVNNVYVTYNGFDHINTFDAEKPQISIPNEYYLAVGSMNPNKNFNAIIDLAVKNPNKQFLIVGGSFKSFKKIEYKIPQNLRFLGYVKDENLIWLYKKAKAFLFPSIYEGFGIPPLEAYILGCKTIICNDIPVLRELFSNIASFVDFNNVDSFNLNDFKPKTIDISTLPYKWEKSAKKIYTCLLEEYKK